MTLFNFSADGGGIEKCIAIHSVTLLTPLERSEGMSLAVGVLL